jgi:uncharacterized protein (DUF302 family)
MVYGIRRSVKLSFVDAVKKVREELSAGGFAIITETDLSKLLKQKIHQDHPEYLLLGVCDPRVTHEMLHLDRTAGLFQPFNLAVYREEKNIIVAVQEPTKIAGLLSNDELDAITASVEKRLRKVIDAI